MIRVIAGLVALAVVSFPGTAAPIAKCAPRPQVSNFLKRMFQEEPSAIGLTLSGQKAVELFVSEKGSFTIVTTETGGKTCLLISGESWTIVLPQAGFIACGPIEGSAICRRRLGDLP